MHTPDSATSLFAHYLVVTGDKLAASNLTLAHAILEGRSENAGAAEVAPKSLSVQEAAQCLNISAKKVYELCQSGKLRSLKIGRAIRIRLDDLESFEEEGLETNRRSRSLLRGFHHRKGR